METVQTIPEWRTTADEIWAVLRETARLQEETAQEMREADKRFAKLQEEAARRQEEADKRFAKLQEEAARRQEEADRRQEEADRRQEKIDRLQEETARLQRETDKMIGELGNCFGQMVEHMVIPNLFTKFNELDFEFTIVRAGAQIMDKKNGIFTEVDAVLENNDQVMAVELRTKPDIDDVKDHIERMKKLRKYADLRGDGRKYFGAVAGVVISEGVGKYILKKGFYMIEPSGDTFNIIEPAGIYHPREW
jgi:DNA repair exonuclease SbcCD ATPase subunit